MPTLVFLHTSPAHLPTFAALAAELAPDLPLRQVVAEDLLAEARAAGLTAALARRVAEALRVAAGADGGAILCTCSTIGGLAEAAGASLGIPVLRVDRAMAARAVRQKAKGKRQKAKGSHPPPASRPASPSSAGAPWPEPACPEPADGVEGHAPRPTPPLRIALVAALESTLGPTRRLLEEEAARAGRAVLIADRLCAGAWPRFEAGDLAGYLAEVAACARGAAAADVIVLAQASMAGAADLLADLEIPVLSSPRLGVVAAVAACRSREAHAEKL